VRGRHEAACGRLNEAEAAFQHGLDQLDGLPLPFEQALPELAHGQMLRRRGRRRAATDRLMAARERFTALGASPFVERCDVELAGSGLTPSKRSNLDPARLTRQELAVATRAATGMSNREIAADMVLSVKTVQFHIGNIYSKLGVRSRLQLANWVHSQSGG
jgi:DNA-binding CsgD family transcriptional regulator